MLRDALQLLPKGDGWRDIYYTHCPFPIAGADTLEAIPVNYWGKASAHTLTDGTGTVYKTGYLHFQLNNCGNNGILTPEQFMLRSKVEFSSAGASRTPADGSAHCTAFASSVSDGIGFHSHYRRDMSSDKL